MDFVKWLENLIFPRSHGVTASTRKIAKEGWRQIEALMSSRNPSSAKQAILNADKLLDAVLKDLVAGETLGERLKAAQNLFSGYDRYQKAWEAHKVRNSLAHEVTYDPPYYVCQQAIISYQEVLKDLGAL
ncbi:MAG: hypothetical protein NT141_03515 [candidate division WWE3 bacterium]|nr:hypothetical protein [candidate division WWE3 bacterium]